MKKIYLCLISAILISNYAWSQVASWLNGKYPEDLHKYTLLVEKMDTVGMLCKDKKGKPIYCSKLEKDNDKNLTIFLAKQQQAFNDYVHKYKILPLNKLQNDTTYADVEKYRYVLRKVLKYRSRTDKKHTEWYFILKTDKQKQILILSMSILEADYIHLRELYKNSTIFFNLKNRVGKKHLIST